LPPGLAAPPHQREHGAYHHPHGRQEDTEQERRGEHHEPEESERKTRQQEADGRSQPCEGWRAEGAGRVVSWLDIGADGHRFGHSMLPFSGITATLPVII